MAAKRIKSNDVRLRAIQAAGTGFVADPFNGWWHLASCTRLDAMTTGEPKWFASERSDLEAFLDARRASYPTAKPLSPCRACKPDRESAGPTSTRARTPHSEPPSSWPPVTALGPPSWWVAGRPATFATAGERPWKELIAAAVPVCAAAHDETELLAAFSLAADQISNNEPDLDNLLEPLLSVVVNRCQWFGGRRPTVMAIAATKQHRAPSGCQISLARAVGEPWDRTATVVSHSFRYPGPLPASARDPVLAEWLTENGATLLPEGAVAVSLRFGGSVNLGDIATGRVKTTIDGLWPLLGGVPGAPADSRITALLTRREDPHAPNAGVSIDVAVLESQTAAPTNPATRA